MRLSTTNHPISPENLDIKAVAINYIRQLRSKTMKAIVYIFVALLALLACTGHSEAYELDLLSEEQWNRLVERNRKFNFGINECLRLH